MASLLDCVVLQVYVASVGPGLLEERMRVGRLLWSNDISAEYSTADNPKFPKQMNEVSQDLRFGLDLGLMLPRRAHLDGV